MHKKEKSGIYAFFQIWFFLRDSQSLADLKMKRKYFSFNLLQFCRVFDQWASGVGQKSCRISAAGSAERWRVYRHNQGRFRQCHPGPGTLRHRGAEYAEHFLAVSPVFCHHTGRGLFIRQRIDFRLLRGKKSFFSTAQRLKNPLSP